MHSKNKRASKNISHSNGKKALPILLILGIALIAATLRAPLTSIGPLVNLIREDLHISNTLAGMITTLPLFAFSLFSPLAPGLARRFGIKRVLLCSIVFLTMGMVLRSFAGSFGLFLGTAILGLSISMGNVLIPSLIKKDFPEYVGSMTGMYSVSMNLFAAIASGISIPLAVGLGLGWTGALQVWALLGVLSILLWIPQLNQQNGNLSDHGISFRRTTEANTAAKQPQTNLWKSPLAWQVTLFMGLQSMVFYCMVAWLPNILADHGMHSVKAGWMLSLMQLALIPVSFVGSVLAERRANQRSLMILGSSCVLIGLMGLLLGGSGLAFLWIIILGIGAGLHFSLAMMFFSLRTRTADEAARLSGMAQSIGYLLAAFGPMLFGYLHDLAGNWTLPLLALLGIAVIEFLAGLGASRNLYVSSADKVASDPKAIISRTD